MTRFAGSNGLLAIDERIQKILKFAAQERKKDTYYGI